MNRSTAADRHHPLYVLTYSRGPHWKVGVPLQEQGLHPHLEYLRGAGEHGAVILAGPYADVFGGIALLLAESAAAAEDFATKDPAVIAGILVCRAARVLPLVGAELSSPRRAPKAEAVVRLLFEAVPRRDMSAIDLYAPEVVIHEADSLPYGGTYTGPEGVVRHAESYLRHWDRLQSLPERQLDPVFVSANDLVLVLWRQRGHGNSGTFDMPAVSMYRLASGRIVESRMFHFDSAAVSDFLSTASGRPSVAQLDAALNGRLEEGGFATALEDFFDDEVEMAEVDQPATAGKPASMARERIFSNALESIKATLLSSAVQGDVSFSEWKYDISFKSGRTMSYQQTARRKWRDGKVVREDFFHADFPSWFAEEMQAAAERAKGSLREADDILASAGAGDQQT